MTCTSTNCDFLCPFPSCSVHPTDHLFCDLHRRSLDRKYLARNRGTVVLPPRRRAA